MASVFANLPVPAADGSGAAVDVRNMSGRKTLTVGGTLAGPSLTVEFSQDNVNWFPVASFSKPGDKEIELAACWMRATIAGYLPTMALAANVDVGAQDGNARAAQLVAPAGDGTGAAVDTHLLGTLNTIVVSGAFTGAVHIEMSEDNVAWLPVTSFTGHTSKTLRFSAHYMRVRRAGALSGLPTVYVAAIDDDDASTALLGYYRTFTQGIGTLDIYVDGVNGDDDNDGLTEATALETIQAVYRKFPTETSDQSTIVVHLAGVGGFDENATSPFEYDIGELRISGEGSTWFNCFAFVGPEMVPITPTTGPATAAADAVPAVAVAGGKASAGGTLACRFDFTVAAPGWTAHDFQGYWLRVTRAGEKVTWEMPIADNGADTILVNIDGIAPLFLNTDTYEIVECAARFVETLIPLSWGYNQITGRAGYNFSTLGDPGPDMGAPFQRCAFDVGAIPVHARSCQFDRCNVGQYDAAYIYDSECQFFNCTCGGIAGGGLESCAYGAQPKETTTTDPILAGRPYAMNLQIVGWCQFMIGEEAGLNNGRTFVIDLGLGINGQTPGANPPITIRCGGIVAMKQRSNFLSKVAIQGAVNLDGQVIVCSHGGQARLRGNAASYAGAVSLWGTIGGDPLGLYESGLTCDYGTGVGNWEEAAGYNGVFYGPPSAGVRGDPVANITAY